MCYALFSLHVWLAQPRLGYREEEKVGQKSPHPTGPQQVFTADPLLVSTLMCSLEIPPLLGPLSCRLLNGGYALSSLTPKHSAVPLVSLPLQVALSVRI